MKQRKINLLIYLLGPVFLIIIFIRLDLNKLLMALVLTKPFYLIIAFIIEIVCLVLKAERWRVIVSMYKDLTFLQAWKATVYGGIYGQITPARIGEGLKVPLIKDFSITYSQIVFTIIIDRFLDLFTIILTGFLGLILLRKILGVNNVVLSLISLLLVVSFLLAYYLKKKLGVITKIADSQEESSGIKWRFYSTIKIIKDNLLVFSDNRKSRLSNKICLAIIINIFHYILYFTSLYFVVIALDIKVPIVFIVLAFSVVALLNLLPISISGIGTRDISLIYFFNKIDVSNEKAIAMSLIVLLLLTYGVSFLCMISVSMIKLFKIA
jgi:glycosyltransferase 2 family protein